MYYEQSVNELFISRAHEKRISRELAEAEGDKWFYHARNLLEQRDLNDDLMGFLLTGSW